MPKINTIQEATAAIKTLLQRHPVTTTVERLDGIRRKRLDGPRRYKRLGVPPDDFLSKLQQVIRLGRSHDPFLLRHGDWLDCVVRINLAINRKTGEHAVLFTVEDGFELDD
jgi:hypothetical protein